MPICALHQSYILQLMDRGAASAVQADSDVTGDAFLLIHAAELDS